MSIPRFLRIKIFSLISCIAIFLTIANILVGYLFLSRSLEEEKIIIINHNSSIRKITNQLADESVIKYKLLFKVIATIYNMRYPLKSGEYRFTSDINPYQVLLKISSGKSIVRRLYIPEGSTTKEIIDKVNETKRLVGQISYSIPEGHLMPSTYFYSYGDRKETLIEIMLDLMSSNLDKAVRLLPSDSPIKTRKEILTLASIIEKEAGNEEEKPIIASVFINRLKKGMRLQADPTVIYSITKGQYKLGRRLRKKDLQISSVYNTYRIYGLPPGPISSPSYSSIMSVVKPTKSNYLYFVVNDKGGHNFATSLEKHNKNVAIFRASRKARR